MIEWRQSMSDTISNVLKYLKELQVRGKCNSFLNDLKFYDELWNDLYYNLILYNKVL